MFNTIDALRAALETSRDLIADAMSTHIYDEANGEKPAPDCAYAAHLALLNTILGDDEDDARHALAKLTWDGPTDSDDEPCFYVNHYHCDECDESWTDQWSCGCDDECPTCEASISPDDSDDVTLSDHCALCGAEHQE